MKQFSLYASTVLRQIPQLKEEKAKKEEMLLADLKLSKNIDQDGPIISLIR